MRFVVSLTVFYLSILCSQAFAQGSVEACMAERDQAEAAIIGDMDFRICIAELAAEKKDRRYCDFLDGPHVKRCHENAANYASVNCHIGEGYEQCMLEAAVEFQSMTLCRHGVSAETGDVCAMMVAAEAGDISILFEEADLDDEQRDALAAQYAVLAKDYSALDYINDDETHDMTLIAVTVGKIGADEPVGPAPCNNLSASSLDSFNRQPFQLDLYAMCLDNVAMMRALATHADTLNDQDLAKLEQIMATMDEFDPETDLSALPIEIRQAYYDERQRTVAAHQSQLPDNPQKDTPGVSAPPQTDDRDEDLSSDDVCIMGIC